MNNGPLSYILVRISVVFFLRVYPNEQASDERVEKRVLLRQHLCVLYKYQLCKRNLVTLHLHV